MSKLDEAARESLAIAAAMSVYLQQQAARLAAAGRSEAEINALLLAAIGRVAGGSVASVAAVLGKDQEQLIGGVETLCNDILQNAVNYYTEAQSRLRQPGRPLQ